MSDLIRLAFALAQQAVVRRGRQAAARMAYALAIALVAIGFAAAAVACALAALWIYVLPRVGPAGAPLVVAGVLLAMCIVALLVMRYVLKRPKRPPNLVAPAALLHAEATRMVRQHKSSALTAAVVAGMAAGLGQK